MARTVDHSKRRDIATRAFEAIRARGVHRTSMSDIAAALEMKRPTLYWYFKDLGEIFDAVMHDRNDKLRAFILARVAEVDHPVDMLAELMRAAFDFYATRVDELIAMYQLWAVSGQDAGASRERSQAFVGRARDELIERLAAGIRDGRVADCDPEQVVELVLAAIDGAQMQHVTRGLNPAIIVEAMCRHVLEPLRIAPAKKHTNVRSLT